jgi:hypothetical protein
MLAAGVAAALAHDGNVSREACDGLRALYAATDGAHWQRNDGWMGDTHCCTPP